MDRRRQGPKIDQHGGSPSASELVAACEQAWTAIQDHHAEVPDVVIVLGSGVERGRLVKLGHWWGGRWIADGDVRGEVLLAGEALHLTPETVFEVLLHEAAHGLNAAQRIQDSSRGGRYHNVRFKATAEDLGLVVEQGRPYGWARTSLGPVARSRYDTEIARLGDAMRIARRVAADVRIGESTAEQGADSGKNGGTQPRPEPPRPATCGCGRRMRMAPSVLAQGPVLCGVCGLEFSTSRRLEGPASPQREPEAAHDPLTARDELTDTPAVQSLGGSDLNATQREGLAVLVELGTHGEGALLLAEAGAWYAARGAETQRPLLGTTWEEVEAANQAARAMLKIDGTLHGQSATAAGRELSVGELVTILDSTEPLVDVQGDELPPFAVFGTIEQIDSARGEIVIDFATAGRCTIALDSAAAAALGYGYADCADTASATSIESQSAEREHEPPSIELYP